QVFLPLGDACGRFQRRDDLSPGVEVLLRLGKLKRVEHLARFSACRQDTQIVLGYNRSRHRNERQDRGAAHRLAPFENQRRYTAAPFHTKELLQGRYASMSRSRTCCGGAVLVALGFAAGWFGRDADSASGGTRAAAQDKTPVKVIPPNDGKLRII